MIEPCLVMEKEKEIERFLNEDLNEICKMKSVKEFYIDFGVLKNSLKIRITNGYINHKQIERLIELGAEITVFVSHYGGEIELWFI